MSHNRPHRQRVRHYHEQGDVHELTFSCYRRMPLVTDDSWRKLLCETIDRAIGRAVERHDFRLFAFVLMPEHGLLIVQPRTALLDEPAVAPVTPLLDESAVTPGDATASAAGEIEDLLFAIKRPYSYRIKQRLIEQRSPLLQRLTVRQRPGVMTFRYWQEGPGYDRNLKEARSIVAAIDYVHMNPVQRGLCERCTDWKWSSARYFLEPHRPIDPDLPRITPLPPDVFD